MSVPTCDYKDNKRCIFKGYTRTSDGEICNSGNGFPYTSGLASYTPQQLNDWLKALYNRNGGGTERDAVTDYIIRCKDQKGYEFLRDAVPDISSGYGLQRGTGTNIPYYNDNVQLLVRRNFTELQKEEYDQNADILGNVDKNLNTVRRQVQIIEDSSQRKGNTLFLLNAVLTALLLSFIPVILFVKGIIGYGVFSIIIITITLLFLVVVFFNLKSVRSRTANRFSSRNFDVPEVLDELKPSDSQCPQTPEAIESIAQQKRDKSVQEINDLESEINRLTEEKNVSKESRDKLENARAELSRRYKEMYPSG